MHKTPASRAEPTSCVGRPPLFFGRPALRTKRLSAATLTVAVFPQSADESGNWQSCRAWSWRWCDGRHRRNQITRRFYRDTNFPPRGGPGSSLRTFRRGGASGFRRGLSFQALQGSLESREFVLRLLGAFGRTFGGLTGLFVSLSGLFEDHPGKIGAMRRSIGLAAGNGGGQLCGPGLGDSVGFGFHAVVPRQHVTCCRKGNYFCAAAHGQQARNCYIFPCLAGQRPRSNPMRFVQRPKSEHQQQTHCANQV
jgi:hypothetical protein